MVNYIRSYTLVNGLGKYSTVLKSIFKSVKPNVKIICHKVRFPKVFMIKVILLKSIIKKHYATYQ